MQNSLPIWQIHASILQTLRDHNSFVLIAPTGSGKTTQVPQMLLDAGFLDDSANPQSPIRNRQSKKLVVLQPRRVAARTVAARVAYERSCLLGGEVGYQVRFDDHTSLGTRICFVTEGILLRWLQDDPYLSDIGIILFDEFHERNLLSDVALALAKQLQQTRRPDLKIAIMSATLDADPVAKYLAMPVESAEGFVPKPCPVLISEGKAFPVAIEYISHHDERPITDQASDAVDKILSSGEPGDILIFMPGMGEISSTINACRALRSHERLAFIPLHGELEPEAQDLAFSPNPLRKVIVSTNVAETSVTIDGIRHVVDSGLARVARYDPERGIGTLFIEGISRASADQRAGRAGRTAPGTCLRLWTESAHLNLAARNTPEIQRSDLAETVLLLHSLGIKNAVHFDWLEKPDPQAVERAENLLRTLGALSSSLDITSVGKQMLRLPMHPRYSRMIVEAAKNNCVQAAALCAALVSGRDLMMRLGRDDRHISEARELFEASADSDFYTLMRAYQFAKNGNFSIDQCRRYGVHGQIGRQVQQTYEQIVQVASKEKLLAPNPQSATSTPKSEDSLLRCITAGFIDQLCKRRDQGTLDCDLTEGRSGTLMRESVVQNSPLFVCASIREVAGRTGEMTLLGLATAVKREWIQEMFPDQITTRVEHLFDRTHKRVSAVKLIRFHDLVIHHEHQNEIDPVATGRCLAEAYVKQYFELPLLNHEVKQLIARVNLVSAAMPELEFPSFDAAAMIKFLTRAFDGLTLVKEAQATPLKDAFFESMGKERLEWLNEMVPTSIKWLEDRKMKLLYPDEPLDEDGEPNSPEIQVKLHETFTLVDHPHICEGKVPVKMWLCTPEGKRLEATFNWPAFKANSYPKLKPALKKKFPALNWI